MPSPFTFIAALAFALLAAALGLNGPSDLQAARATAATLADAQEQAAQDHARAHIDRIAADMAQGRPDGISPDDWAAATRALAIAQGR